MSANKINSLTLLPKQSVVGEEPAHGDASIVVDGLTASGSSNFNGSTDYDNWQRQEHVSKIKLTIN